MHKRIEKIVRALRAAMLLLICVSALSHAIAQQPATTRYVYDENGRLRAVIAPTGEAAIYDYDPAGNITAIRRLGADGFELLSFAPAIGAIGDRVTLYGVGIGVGVNSVSFNGVAAQVVESNSIKVIAIVPNGATTGPITLATARGTATTSSPFTVKGVGISPASARIFERDRLQFTAVASTTSGDQSVKWSVNGVEGGNATVGAISPTGLYVAPGLPNNVATANFTVRATSVAEPDLFREAEVVVRNLGTVRVIAASGVSVSIPIPGVSTTVFAANSPAVSVSAPVPGVTTTTFAAVSRGVSVSAPLPGVTTTTFAAVGRGVSVSLPVLGVTTTSFSPVSPGVSVGTPVTGVSTTTTSAFSPGVSVAVNLPSISSVAPGRVARGATANITITGTNLTGVTTLRFFTLSGAFDSTISISNLSVAAGGNSLTATITVSANAATGRRMMVVATPTLPSLAIDSVNTTIEITTQ